MRTIAFFLLFFIFFLEIVRNFFQDYAASWWLQGPIPNKSDPDPDPKSDPEPDPEPSAWTLVRKPNNCSQFDLDAAASGDLCCAGCCFPGLQLPNTEQLFGFLTREAVPPWRNWVKNRTIVTSYAYLERCARSFPGYTG